MSNQGTCVIHLRYYLKLNGNLKILGQLAEPLSFSKHNLLLKDENSQWPENFTFCQMMEDS